MYRSLQNDGRESDCAVSVWPQLGLIPWSEIMYQECIVLDTKYINIIKKYNTVLLVCYSM